MTKMTFGQRVADRVVDAVGSWSFIITQSIILCFWIAWNSHALEEKRFDPAPFVLMSFALSAQAAFATPLILISQKRQLEIDRQRDIETHSHARSTLVSTVQIMEELETLEEKLHLMETDIIAATDLEQK
jgi:uncharacterized membrane protein